MEYEKQMDELKKVYSDSVYNDIDSCRRHLFTIILNQNGFLEFDNPVYINSYKIKKIFASSFHEQMNIHGATELEWNMYIQKLKDSVMSENYHTPIVRNNKVIGVMKFMNNDGEEINMDIFNKKWISLLEKVYVQRGKTEMRKRGLEVGKDVYVIQGYVLHIGKIDNISHYISPRYNGCIRIKLDNNQEDLLHNIDDIGKFDTCSVSVHINKQDVVLYYENYKKVYSEYIDKISKQLNILIN